MKTAVVYYSYDGNSAFVAEQIKNKLNADLVRIEMVDEKKRSFFGMILWYGFHGKKPAIKPHNFDPEAYDLIILGAPVWAGSVASPLKGFLSGTRISGKKIALFLCHAGGIGKAMNKFKKALEGNSIVCETDFINPVKQDPEEQKKLIEGFVKKITGALS